MLSVCLQGLVYEVCCVPATYIFSSQVQHRVTHSHTGMGSVDYAFLNALDAEPK